MERRESETVEFKKSTSELHQGVISLVSMLNKSGSGTLYFGINNSGEAVGQQLGKDTTHDISVEIKNHIRPAVVPGIELVEVDGKTVIRVTVCGSDGPYSAYSRFYVRSDDEDLVMTNEDLARAFAARSLDYSAWENAPSGHGLEDVDEDRLIGFFDAALDCGRLGYAYKDVEDALSRLNLYSGGQLNNAGYYLFSKCKPVKLKLAVFNTDDRISFSDIRLFEGNILDCIETGVRYICDNIRWSGTISGYRRVEEPEIPIEAIREIVVNSFAHMKVSPSILNEIYITPSRVKITNAGSIARGLDPRDFASGKEGPILRNPLIAMALYRNGMIDSFATGFERVFRLCSEKGIGYEYSDNGYSFSFSFLRKGANRPSWDNDGCVSESVSERGVVYGSASSGSFSNAVSGRKQAILDMLRRDSTATTELLAQSLGVSVPTIARDLRNLQTLGLLRRVGATKNGHWEVSDRRL